MDQWLLQDLKTALANAPHPINAAVGIYKGTSSGVIGLIREHNVKVFIAHAVPDDYNVIVYTREKTTHGTKPEMI